MVSKVPAHEIGQACLNALRRFGVHTDYVLRGGDRLGLLYMEVGASQRATKVIYDRAASSFASFEPRILHRKTDPYRQGLVPFFGTAPALGPQVVEALTTGLATARQLGTYRRCDCNYRSKLWSKEEAGRGTHAALGVMSTWAHSRQRRSAKLFGISCPRRRPFGRRPAATEYMVDSLRRRFDLD